MSQSHHMDLESCHHRRSSSRLEEGSVCLSDVDEGSCCSQFYSTADGYLDECSSGCASYPQIGELPDSRKASSVAGSDLDIENGVLETNMHMVKVERDCRICQLSLETTNLETAGIAIELGCSCKGDLAAVHKHCAETWFKIRGNKTCEICNSVAWNVVSANDIEPAQQRNETNAMATNTTMASAASGTETLGCLNGHRILNFLLACMVFGFVLSWLFRFNMPS